MKPHSQQRFCANNRRCSGAALDAAVHSELQVNSQARRKRQVEHRPTTLLLLRASAAPDRAPIRGNICASGYAMLGVVNFGRANQNVVVA
ncbi:hypothetical protein BKN37_25990 [Mycobacterium talmoniae]|uniref:Uncharacterized protein n=1 Tax=Mycobacterium talmoniae TaxID=1858794 RepID=A0A1S1MQM9_9MYCO|nr:hypothetical protein [Mycobacterium eburneum]OHU87269.1 hypothetical protein BKN37_25990 [Mycobacterium talmoniae]TDH50669.1 hypothetical protein E2F47_17550 [Mycobacterium eburneum]